MSTEKDHIGMVQINGMQIRMARAALHWSIAKLAREAKVAEPTIKRIENPKHPVAGTVGLDATRDYRTGARASVLDAIAGALTAAGVTLLSDDGAAGPGVRVEPRAKRK
jgi:transcriptional regulator with XRE-family HTH domain